MAIIVLEPGVIDTKTVIMSTKAYSVFISWSLPCYPNGILTHYGVERANKDNASDVQLYDLETNSMNITDGILPYRNYTFKVRAYTSIGPGNFTSPKYAQTHPAGMLNSVWFITHLYLFMQISLNTFFQIPEPKSSIEQESLETIRCGQIKS